MGQELDWTTSFNERSKGRLPEHMGVVCTAARPGPDGGVQARFEIAPHHMAPNGYLHAASLVALLDTTCGYGCMINLPAGAKGFTTIELKTNFLGTATEGGVRASARPVHLGRTTQIWDAEATSEATGRSLALFRCTQMVLWPKA